MTAFNKFVLLLLALRYGVEGVEESGMKPRSASDKMKSFLRVVISRIVDNEMKFCRTASAVVVIIHILLTSSQNVLIALWGLPSERRSAHAS